MDLKMDRLHPADGIKEDLIKFIEAFTKLPSYKFVQFAQLWRDRRFVLLSCGRRTMENLRDFLNCLFYTIMDFTQPPHPYATKLCAVYLLYAFYFRQLLPKKIRIRVSLTQWHNLMAFYRQLSDEQQFYDFRLIFSTLMSHGAFDFCATRHPYYPNVPLPTPHSPLSNAIDSMHIRQFKMGGQHSLSTRSAMKSEMLTNEDDEEKDQQPIINSLSNEWISIMKDLVKQYAERKRHVLGDDKPIDEQNVSNGILDPSSSSAINSHDNDLNLINENAIEGIESIAKSGRQTAIQLKTSKKKTIKRPDSATSLRKRPKVITMKAGCNLNGLQKANEMA